MNKLNYKNKKTILFTISLILFIILSYYVFNDKITTLDTYISNKIYDMRSDNLTNIMTIITNISSAYSLIAISILILIIYKIQKIPILISLNLIFSFITSQIAKVIFRRDRPLIIPLVEASGFSFPSGHAMVSMAYFGFIIYLVLKNIKNKIKKYLLITFLTIIILLIGFSRIYLGVHYFSDIIGGFLLSISYLMIFITIIKKNLYKEHK